MNETGFDPRAHELERFFATWEREAKHTLRLLQALPAGRYDFRPDPEGRSLGELAWHLAETDGYFSHSIVTGSFAPASSVPGIERPRTIEALAPGYERAHREAVDRLRGLTPAALDHELSFLGRTMKVRVLLWAAILHHHIHHRGQLSLMIRLAGGVLPITYGPTREQTAASRAAATTQPPA